MNRVEYMGRAIKDIELKWSSGTKPVAIAKFTIAVPRDYKKEGEPDADFISCIAYGKVAEVLEKYIKKGTAFIVNGRTQTGSYKNKEGATIYTNDCIVSGFEFLPRNKDKSEGQATDSDTNPNEAFMNIPSGVDDFLPFA